MRCLGLVLLAVLGLAQSLNVYPNYVYSPNAVNTGPKFFRLNGRTADPCVNKEGLGTTLLGGWKSDCTDGKDWPEPATLVLVPTSQSRPTVAATDIKLTLYGKNLATGASLALSTGIGAAASCAAVDVANAQTFLAGTTSFNIPDAWRTQAMELETSGHKLCYKDPADANYRWTGFRITAVWDCDPSAGAARSCASLPYGLGLPATDAAAGKVAPANLVDGDPLTKLTAAEQILRTRRTQCIRTTKWGANDVDFAVGQCINPNITAACQGAAYDPTTQRCCDATQSLVQSIGAPCNCRPDGSKQSPVCPAGETCCYQTKYSELTGLFTNPATSLWPEYFGECYNPATHRCCDTGYRYDPKTQQCCSINGIQGLTLPCPCDSDMDCRDGTPGTVSMYCCKQYWPTPFESADALFTQSDNKQLTARCNKYNNYPSTLFPDTTYPIGTAPALSQRCLGTCLDERYQICCNGIACHREFDVCCNSTCCNKFIGGCIEGRIPGTPNNRFNYNELDQPYEMCTTIEIMNPLRGFWVFVWPAYLLLMTCVCLAFVIAFVNKVSRRSFSFLERAIMTLAFFAILFGFPCYFAPVYKYGVWITIVSLFTIIVAGARSKGLNIVLVLVQFLTIMYLFDPFTGNNYLGFSSDRVANGDPDPESAGILHSVYKMFHTRPTFGSPFASLQDSTVTARRFCTTFYDYFMKDPQLQDFRRDNIAVPSFGYCGHGWVTALIIFEGISLIIALVLFLLDLVALILRFKEERSPEAIELEVRGADEVPQY